MYMTSVWKNDDKKKQLNKLLKFLEIDLCDRNVKINCIYPLTNSIYSTFLRRADGNTDGIEEFKDRASQQKVSSFIDGDVSVILEKRMMR